MTLIPNPFGLDPFQVITAIRFPAAGGPTCTSVTPNQIEINDTATVFGIDFGDTQGAGIVELGNATSYAASTLVEQTVTSWSDTEIEFTYDPDTLDDDGTRFFYVYVTNDGGQTNALGCLAELKTGYERIGAANVTTGISIAAGESIDGCTAETTSDFGQSVSEDYDEVVLVIHEWPNIDTVNDPHRAPVTDAADGCAGDNRIKMTIRNAADDFSLVMENRSIDLDRDTGSTSRHYTGQTFNSRPIFSRVTRWEDGSTSTERGGMKMELHFRQGATSLPFTNGEQPTITISGNTQPYWSACGDIPNARYTDTLIFESPGTLTVKTGGSIDVVEIGNFTTTQTGSAGWRQFEWDMSVAPTNGGLFIQVRNATNAWGFLNFKGDEQLYINAATQADKWYFSPWDTEDSDPDSDSGVCLWNFDPNGGASNVGKYTVYTLLAPTPTPATGDTLTVLTGT